MHTALFDAIPDALIIVDGAGSILMANRMAYRLFGYAPPALVGASVEMLLPDDLRERHRRHRRAFKRQPRERPMGHANMPLLGRRRDGSAFPVEVALNPLRIGPHMQVLASIRDVSATSLAQRAERRGRHDAALALVGQHIVGGDDEEQVMQAVACELTDAVAAGPVWIVRRDPALPSRFRSSGVTDAPHDWLARQGAALFASLDHAQAPPTRVLAVAAELLPAGMAVGLAAPLRLDDGSVPAAIVLFSRDREAFDDDVVQLVQTVATLLSATLQRQRVSDALAHAQRLEAIGKLTGGVAHDFNNLLTVVSGNLQMLEAHVEADAEARELLAAAARAANQGAALTRKLLSFAGRQRLRPTVVSLAREVRELERLARATLGERIRFSIDVDADAPPVRVDASMLDSVVLNLVINARDAIDGRGDVAIRVSDEWIGAGGRGPVPAGHYVGLAVRDTGRGMSGATLAHALEPFYTTKPAGRGTGLGLSMVYGFTRQSGGHMHLQSRPGDGTTVTLYLPAVDAAADAVTESPAVAGGDEVVLVVEDDDAVRATVEGQLKSLGYHVIATASSQAALECVETLGDIALLFTDLTLAEALSGAELAREARRVRPDIAVLLTSGYPDATGTGRLDRFALLAKPYALKDLARAVRAALSEAGSAQVPA